MPLLLLALACRPEGPVVYVDRDGVGLTLDLWRPVGAAPAGAVLLVHGGGWAYGHLYSGGVREQAEAAAAAGLLVVSPDYRLSGDAPWPAPFHDVGCALRWMGAHADQLGVDATRVVGVGHSAGGHLVAMLGEAPERLAADPGCPWPEGPRLAGVASLAGPTDLEVFWAETEDWGRDMALQLLALDAGASPESDAAAFADASPVAWVDPEGPAVLQVAGSDDVLVPPAVARSFAAALAGAGREAELVEVDEGHNALNRVEAWLDWAEGR